MKKGIKGIHINNKNLNLSEEDMNKILTVKNGLEDLNLIVQEIESTYKILSSENLTESEVAINKKRMKSLEKLLADINHKVNSAMSNEYNKSQLS